MMVMMSWLALSVYKLTPHRVSVQNRLEFSDVSINSGARNKNKKIERFRHTQNQMDCVVSFGAEHAGPSGVFTTNSPLTLAIAQVHQTYSSHSTIFPVKAFLLLMEKSG